MHRPNESKWIDISIPLDFYGAQPNAFGGERASEHPLGDTREGSSVNFARYSLAPHCSGTHTECVGHITHDRISIVECLTDVMISAVLVSVEPENDTGECYAAREAGDSSITAASLRKAIDEVGGEAHLKDGALIVRTLPNDDLKLSAAYDNSNIPTYFTDQAIDIITDLGVKHLLVDLPSIDRISDGGLLSNHRKFWNLPAGSFEAGASTRRDATITELIYVPSEISDGLYQLNLQIAPFVADAAPSRPMIRRL